MEEQSEIQSIINAIQQSRFTDAQQLIAKASDPRALSSALSLIYIAEATFQLHQIAGALQRLEKIERGQLSTPP